MNKKYLLCFYICFDSTIPDWIKNFLKISEDIKNKLNIIYTRYGCSYLDSKADHKDYKFSESSYEKIINQNKSNKLNGINFYFLESENTPYYNPNFCIDIWGKDRNPFWKMYIQLDLELFLTIYKDEWHQIIHDYFLLFSNIGAITYGIIELIPKKKIPGFQFRGWPNSKSNKFEIDIIRKWDNVGLNYKHFIKDIYSVNYLSHGHYKKIEKNIENIKNIIGPNNIFSFLEGHFLVLPFEPKEIIKNKKKIKIIKNQLRPYIEDILL